jgi:hypothetical protein
VGIGDKNMAKYHITGVYHGENGVETLWTNEYDTEKWTEKCLHTHLTKMRPIWLEDCERVVAHRVKDAKNGYRLLSFVEWGTLLNEIWKNDYPSLPCPQPEA